MKTWRTPERCQNYRNKLLHAFENTAILRLLSLILRHKTRTVTDNTSIFMIHIPMYVYLTCIDCETAKRNEYQVYFHWIMATIGMASTIIVKAITCKTSSIHLYRYIYSHQSYPRFLAVEFAAHTNPLLHFLLGVRQLAIGWYLSGDAKAHTNRN